MPSDFGDRPKASPINCVKYNTGMGSSSPIWNCRPSRLRWHSGQATAITIAMDGDDDRMQLSVEDNGIGIPEDLETEGMGLRIMGFRANMIHAVLDIQSPESGGTRVRVSLGSTAATTSIIK